MAALDLRQLRPVLFPLDPIPGETLRGYAGRVSEHNCYENPAQLLSVANIAAPKLWHSDLDLDRLAQLYNVGTDRLERMAVRPITDSNKTVRWQGLILPRSVLRKEYCPVSPAALARAPHHRHTWSIRYLSFCSEDWNLLIDTCPEEACGAKLRWHNGPIHRCGSCHSDLRNAKSQSIRPEDRALLKVAADLVSHELGAREEALKGLGDFGNGLSPGEALTAITVIGDCLRRASHPMASVKRPPMGYPVSLIAGMRFVSQSIEVQRKFYEDASLGCISRARRELHGRASWKTPAVKKVVMSAFRSKDIFGKEGGVTITKAAQALRLPRSVVRDLICEGFLLAHVRAGGDLRRHDDIDRASLDKLLEIIDAAASVGDIASQYRLRWHVAKSLLSAGGAKKCESKEVKFIYADTRYDRVSANECMAKIERQLVRTTQADADRISLGEVLGRRGNRARHWISVLAAPTMVPDGLGSFAPSGLDPASLNVSQRGAEFIRQALDDFGDPWELAGSLRLVDVEQMLGCYPRDIQRLLQSGALARLEKGICALSVAMCRAALISTKDLASATGLDAADVAEFARSRGIARPYPGVGFWNLREVTAVLDLCHIEDRCAAGSLSPALVQFHHSGNRTADAHA